MEERILVKLSRSELRLGSSVVRHKLVIQSDPMSKYELSTFLFQLGNSVGLLMCGPVAPHSVSLEYGGDSWTLTAFGDVEGEPSV